MCPVISCEKDGVSLCLLVSVEGAHCLPNAKLHSVHLSRGGRVQPDDDGGDTRETYILPDLRLSTLSVKLRCMARYKDASLTAGSVADAQPNCHCVRTSAPAWSSCTSTREKGRTRPKTATFAPMRL